MQRVSARLNRQFLGLLFWAVVPLQRNVDVLYSHPAGVLEIRLGLLGDEPFGLFLDPLGLPLGEPPAIFLREAAAARPLACIAASFAPVARVYEVDLRWDGQFEPSSNPA